MINGEGTNNAGRMFITFHDSKENAPTIDAIPTSDLPDQFNMLNEQVSTELFVAHRITSPLIFGIRESGSLGNRNELIEAYELYKNIYVADRQASISSVFNYILSFHGVDLESDTETFELYFDPSTRNYKFVWEANIGAQVAFLDQVVYYNLEA